jgi:glucose-1-phosphate cytidylyltransferase
VDVVILCGGRATRFYPETVETPKPLVTVGGVPIIEHIMAIYAAQLPEVRFVLAAGHLVERFVDRYQGSTELPIEVIDTGLDTGTGERIRRARAHLAGGTFLATYGDGLGDVDVGAVLERHRAHGRLATLTTVPLPSQYGTVDLDGDEVRAFKEKPRLMDHWINGGFFAFEPAALDHPGDSLEDEVLPSLASAGQLVAHRHDGFWQSMDTFKDRVALDLLAEAAVPPWARPVGASGPRG